MKTGATRMMKVHGSVFCSMFVALYASHAAEPFSAIRLRKPQTDSPKVWQATVEQFRKYRAGVDEVWFSTGICFPKMDEHRANAQRLATASEDLRRIGILPSLQIQSTIGHGDVFTRYADNSEFCGDTPCGVQVQPCISP